MSRNKSWQRKTKKKKNNNYLLDFPAHYNLASLWSLCVSWPKRTVAFWKTKEANFWANFLFLSSASANNQQPCSLLRKKRKSFMVLSPAERHGASHAFLETVPLKICKYSLYQVHRRSHPLLFTYAGTSNQLNLALTAEASRSKAFSL